MTAHLFVYGTLMSGQKNPMQQILARSAAPIGPGRMRGRLFLLDEYPGLVDSDDPAEAVLGEVWRLLDLEVLRTLDEYEGCLPQGSAPPLFVRSARPVEMDGDGTLTAWVYVYARSTAGQRAIPSGDWRAFRREESPCAT